MKFLANGVIADCGAGLGSPALDYLREVLGFTGTKEGCREGDCGACSVLVGEALADGEVAYRAVPSCLLSLGELAGRHLLTIEGLVEGARAAGLEGGLSPVMAALLEENGSQCGFCSPGIVINLTAWLLGPGPRDEASALRAIEGNLCRCTGYGAIRRAAARLVADFAHLPEAPGARREALVAAGVLPPSVLAFARGEAGLPRSSSEGGPAGVAGPVRLGGGTDYYVRNPEPPEGFSPRILGLEAALGTIESEAGGLRIGAATRVADFFASPAVRAAVPGIEAYEAEFASSLIRGRATLGGNVANASPVGDLTSILLSLGVQVRISGGSAARDLPLEALFLGYKKLDLKPGEYLRSFLIPLPVQGRRAFSFEKVSKRRRLDIASANTGLCLEVAGSGAEARILRGRLSAGGMGPTPLFLPKASALLEGATPGADLARRVAAAAVAETTPQSDVRGSADYRRRLLERLVLGHFLRLFPESGIAEELFP